MRSWIGRSTHAKTISPGNEVTFHFSDFTLDVAAQDAVFVVDSSDPAILYGWGTVVKVSHNERLVVGDDEEANTPPYQTYYKVGVRVVCREAFVLPLSLAAYLSAEDFKAFEDEYGHQYGGELLKLPAVLAEKLNQAMGYRRSTGAPVFLSYAREDLDIALQLHKQLSAQGFQVWVDKVSLVPGQDWKREIARAIRTSKAFIALLSSNSLSKRGYVQKELRLGLEVLDELPPSQIYLIPVRMEPCIPEHPRLNDLHWVDLFPDFEEGVHALMSAIRTLG
jgi:hypothetical protein